MAALTTGALIVFGLILVALVLFVTEPIPNDVTAIGVLVALAVLQPWTGVDSRTAIAGFASPATVTIIAMYILSAGIQETGIVGRLGYHLARITRGSETKLLGATVGSTGLTAGLINNTPVVAVFIPMITELAEDANISPSKLLMPLSFAAMMGGTLTLIGTSTNILASDLSARLLNHPLSMFEFTGLGLIVLAVGIGYLMTLGRWLTPARIEPDADLTETFDLEDHLARLVVPEGSPSAGRPVDEVLDEIQQATELDLDVLQVDRDGETFLAAATDQVLEVGDEVTVRASEEDAARLAGEFGLRHLRQASVEEEDLTEDEDSGTLVEVVVPPDSGLVGDPIAETGLEESFDTTVLAVRRGSETIQEDLDELEVEAGDTLLLQTTPEAVDYLAEAGEFFVTHAPEAGDEADEPGRPGQPGDRVDEEPVEPLSPRTPMALAIMGLVVGTAALGWVPIVIAALGGVVAMVATGCIRPSEAYDSVSWNVIFLLAGVIPLGFAMQQTGGADWLASLLVQSADVLPVVAMLGLFYVVTGLLANIITPVASVVLMIPIAVDTATRIGGEPFTFLLGVMFAGSAAFMTPIGYQTNLMVYGPGGYKFTDYLRVGGPLQLLLAVVTTVGLWLIWGV